MTQLLHHRALADDSVGFGEIIAIMGEIYLIGLAVPIPVAALANVAGLPAGITLSPIIDPAIAAAFTA